MTHRIGIDYWNSRDGIIYWGIGLYNRGRDHNAGNGDGCHARYNHNRSYGTGDGDYYNHHNDTASGEGYEIISGHSRRRRV